MITSLNKLNIGSLTLHRYADLDYDEWYAMSEFVDNSLHSFMNNKKELYQIGINQCEVRISILDNGEGEEINILDNSGGIHSNDFERLLSLGIPKEKCETQLSEFGMGMKTSSIWFGKLVEIETKHYLEDKCYKITIDIEKLGTDSEVKIEEVKPSSNKKCFTKIKVSNLNRKLSRKKNKIKESLASIYRKFIESGDMTINFEDDELKPFSIELRESQDGSPMRKDFEIKLKNGKKAKGWIGIMVKGKTIISGFSVYRNNRLIQGYPENSWRPKEVFGQEGGSNTTKNQRLIGELDMTMFNVAHTKNKINFVDDEETEFRKQLGDFCSDISREADNTLKPKTVKEHESKPNTQLGKEVVTEFFKKQVNTDVKSLEFTSPTIKTKTPSRVKEIYDTEKNPFYDFSHMKDVDGINKSILVYHFMDSNLPYMIMDEIEDNLVVCININHPYYSHLSNNGTTEKEIEFKINCVIDALSEVHNKNRYGSYTPEDMRLTKDLFLKRWIQSMNS
jgi:hypothetical protein